MSTRIATSADVDPRAIVGEDCRVWHQAQIREHAVLGPGCIVGRGAYVDAGVQIGRNAKIQNYALVYAPAVLGDGVFIGPAAVLTNDVNPRAVRPDGERKAGADWEPRPVTVGDGAAVGAHATVVAGVRIGAWALVGAGAVVTRDIPDHALVVGTPAKQVGWVGRAGYRLHRVESGELICPIEGTVYTEHDGALMEVP